MKPLLIAWTGAALLALALPAAAQTGTPQPDGQQPCQAEPDQKQDQQQKTNGEEQTGAGKDSLTGKLAPCGGVLQPPPTGDSEAAKPAPDEGNTPIIKPGEVPPQPPKQQ